MNNLKKKIFILLTSILSLFLFFLLLIFNISVYNRESSNVKDRLMRINNSHEKLNINHFDNRNPVFIDEEIYIVKFNVFGNIEKIVNYSQNGMSENEITELINDNENKIEKNKISSIYTSDYIFFLNRDNNLIIMNNKNTKKYLFKSLLTSLILFIILEILIIYISYLITKWIVKPVDDAFQKQKQFIFDASHELKTPLAIIQASAEILDEKPKEKKWLNNIKEEIQRMNKLVINLLELSKTENMKEKEVYSIIDLSKLIEKKSLSFESLIFENNLSLETNIEKSIMFNCNADRIKELLSILIDNAIKHGINKSRIVVSLFKEKNNIVLSVKNKGEEIPINEQKKIFERFYRLDKSRNRNDNRYGLGLSIAKNIVDNHNGNIKVVCENGYTTFKVIFK